MHYLSRRRRPSRRGEWTDAKAVTFIVTLAARRSVTLAAARAGMSRKAAYALRSRDRAFAAAWVAACRAGSRDSKGDKGDELYNPPVAPPGGNSASSPQDYTWFYETLARWRGESAGTPLARAATLP